VALALLSAAAALVGATLASSGAGGESVAASRLGPQAPGAAAAAVPVQWCGTDAASADRKPDLRGGNSVHVIYAVPSDGQEQFGAYVHRIVTDLGAVDAWWRRQDPSRAPRFDVHAFAGCTTAAGQIDVSSVRLAQPSALFARLDDRVRNLASSLAAAGFADASKKYLVYYDGPLSEPLDVCGTAFRGPTATGGSGSVAAVWLRACVTDVGAGDIQAAVAAHELLHQLGALPPGAPHSCPNDQGHPCDSGQDLMYPRLSFPFDELVLDVGRDDYYGHSGGWFDTQDSLWLGRADVSPSTLTLGIRGTTAEDRVASTPVGIACPTTCSVLFDTGSQVRLVAEGGAGSRLVRWGGACTGREACTVTMDAAKTVEAIFGPSRFRLTIVVTGGGRVNATALGFSCARRCSQQVEADSAVRLRVAATTGWRFVRWSGACRGRAACSVRLSENRAVGAVFQKLPRRKR
jgi:Divergent InlB B-repeat domain